MFRWGSHVSLLAILLALFVIPHDPSSSLDPARVGSSAMRAPLSTSSSRVQRGAVTRTSELAPKPPRVAPVAMQAASALLRPPSGPLSAIDEEWQRLVKCAACKPKATARVVARKAQGFNLAIGEASSSRHDVGGSSRILARRAMSFMPWGDADRGAKDLALATPAANGTAYGLYTTVEELRSVYGEGRTLSATETRELYHSLLPTQLLDEGDESTLAERAELAIKARRAARLYARERAKLPVTISSELMDGVRTFIKQGSFQSEGMSEEQIWQKYAGISSPREVEGLDDEVYHTILRKACTSNQHVDKLCLTLASSAAGWTVGGLASGMAAAAATSLGKSLQEAGL